MTATIKWINDDVAAGKKAAVSKVMPGKTYSFAATFEKAAADGDGSVFYLASVGAKMVPYEIMLNCDSLAGCTSVDLGFYKENGVVADKDVLMAAHDINAGAALGSEIDGLHDMGVDKIGKQVYELLDKTVDTRENAYLLALTLNTAGSAAGTISVRGLFIQG
jgi:hypothetical protein